MANEVSAAGLEGREFGTGQAAGAGEPGRVVRWLTVLALAVTLGLLVLGTMILGYSRDDAWEQAQEASDNLVLVLTRDIARNISVYDLSLKGAIDALAQPGIWAVSPEIRQAAIFDRAATAEYLGSLLALGPTGDIVADSTSLVPHKLNLGDRDYFQVHLHNPNVGLFFSKPFKSRLRDGDSSIAISRRMSNPDGSFAGVVVGTMRLAYFLGLFETLNLGPHGAVSLLQPDGTLVVRQPFNPNDMGRHLEGEELFRRSEIEKAGQFRGQSMYDGSDRAITYRQVGQYPLLLVKSASLDDIFASWRRKAVVIGSMLALLCGATMILCLLFRRELSRRLVAEAALVESAERLTVIASTDGLTGLANRRTFEADLLQEWRRAIRSRGPVALLMLDADWFKAYNDRYGHQAGDEVLRRIGTCIQENIRRPGDLGARYGGEEFVALLPDTDLSGAMNTAERIGAAVRGMAVAHEGSPLGTVSLSIGIASLRPEMGEDPAELVKLADTALYEAKRTGRARACVAPVREAAAG